MDKVILGSGMILGPGRDEVRTGRMRMTMNGHHNIPIHGGQVLHGQVVDGRGVRTGISGNDHALGTRTGPTWSRTTTIRIGRRDHRLRARGMPVNYVNHELYGTPVNVINAKDVTLSIFVIRSGEHEVIGAMDIKKTAIREKKTYQSCLWFRPPRSALGIW